MPNNIAFLSLLGTLNMHFVVRLPANRLHGSKWSLADNSKGELIRSTAWNVIKLLLRHLSAFHTGVKY